jgi:hypothetical protein
MRGGSYTAEAEKANARPPVCPGRASAGCQLEVRQFLAGLLVDHVAAVLDLAA